MSQQQYSSPKIWGPHFWYMLRCIAYNYPLKPSSDDAEHVKIWFNELQYLLPCELCKYTFRQHFAKYPIDKGLINKASLIEWVETIYQETKKVIQDKRIKILDIYEEIDQVVPIKAIYKQKIDPIEEQLNEMRRNVMKKDNYSRAIQVPPALHDNRSSHSLHKQNNRNVNSQKINNNTKQLNGKTFKINDQPSSTIEKINVGRKSEIEQTHKFDAHGTLVIQPKMDIGFGKIVAGKKMDFEDSVKKVTSKVIFSDQNGSNLTLKSQQQLPISKIEAQLPLPKTEPFKPQPLPIQKPRQKQQSYPKNPILKFESPNPQPIIQPLALKLELPKQQPNSQSSILKLELAKPQLSTIQLIPTLPTLPKIPTIPTVAGAPTGQIIQTNQTNSRIASVIEDFKKKQMIKLDSLKHNNVTPISYVDRKQADIERQLRYIPQQKYYLQKCAQMN